MISVTLQQAKATLNRLVEKARAGEQVVLMRGSTVVATIQPLTSRDVEIVPRLSDAQAECFWNEIATDTPKTFSSAARAVKSLKS